MSSRATPTGSRGSQREAQTLASLNHPNIATIHGLEDSGGRHALVMELVEGEDLSAAHRARSDPHRRGAADCKANRGGARSGARAGDHPSRSQAREYQSPTRRHGEGAGLRTREGDGTRPASVRSPNVVAVADDHLACHDDRRGIILGTAAYMVPEQARGKAVDRRADIWAFGVVLYEMLTGRRAFEGDDIAITLAAVMMKEPDWRALPAATPAALRRLLIRCLKKDPKARLRDIGEARLQIEELLSGAQDEAGVTAAPRTPSLWRRMVPWAAAGAARYRIDDDRHGSRRPAPHRGRPACRWPGTVHDRAAGEHVVWRSSGWRNWHRDPGGGVS